MRPASAGAKSRFSNGLTLLTVQVDQPALQLDSVGAVGPAANEPDSPGSPDESARPETSQGSVIRPVHSQGSFIRGEHSAGSVRTPANLSSAILAALMGEGSSSSSVTLPGNLLLPEEEILCDHIRSRTNSNSCFSSVQSTLVGNTSARSEGSFTVSRPGSPAAALLTDGYPWTPRSGFNSSNLRAVPPRPRLNAQQDTKLGLGSARDTSSSCGIPSRRSSRPHDGSGDADSDWGLEMTLGFNIGYSNSAAASIKRSGSIGAALPLKSAMQPTTQIKNSVLGDPTIPAASTAAAAAATRGAVVQYNVSGHTSRTTGRPVSAPPAAAAGSAAAVAIGDSVADAASDDDEALLADMDACLGSLQFAAKLARADAMPTAPTLVQCVSPAGIATVELLGKDGNVDAGNGAVCAASIPGKYPQSSTAAAISAAAAVGSNGSQQPIRSLRQQHSCHRMAAGGASNTSSRFRPTNASTEQLHLSGSSAGDGIVLLKIGSRGREVPLCVLDGDMRGSADGNMHNVHLQPVQLQQQPEHAQRQLFSAAKPPASLHQEMQSPKRLISGTVITDGVEQQQQVIPQRKLATYGSKKKDESVFGWLKRQLTKTESSSQSRPVSAPDNSTRLAALGAENSSCCDSSSRSSLGNGSIPAAAAPAAIPAALTQSACNEPVAAAASAAAAAASGIASQQSKQPGFHLQQQQHPQQQQQQQGKLQQKHAMPKQLSSGLLQQQQQQLQDQLTVPPFGTAFAVPAHIQAECAMRSLISSNSNSSRISSSGGSSPKQLVSILEVVLPQPPNVVSSPNSSSNSSSYTRQPTTSAMPPSSGQVILAQPPRICNSSSSMQQAKHASIPSNVQVVMPQPPSVTSTIASPRHSMTGVIRAGHTQLNASSLSS